MAGRHGPKQGSKAFPNESCVHQSTGSPLPLRSRFKTFRFLLLILAVALLCHAGISAFNAGWAQAVGLPTLDIKVGSATSPQEVSKGLQILILLTVLTLAPAILIMTTAFTRIVIVLSLVRQAIGTPQLPPGQVIVGLSLILTFFVMSPTINKINTEALQPYLKSEMAQDAALTKAIDPLLTFMFKQTSQNDL